MRNTTKILLINILIIISYFNSFAQTDKDFWFCVPQVTWQHEGDIPKLLITALDADADVTIEMPMESQFQRVTIHVPKNTSYTYKFDAYMQCPSQGSKKGTHQEDNILESGLYLNGSYESCKVKNKGIHISSTALITAYLERGWTNNDDIWALKGKNALGTEFIVPSQNSFKNHNFGGTSNEDPNAWNAIDIVAVEDCKVTVDLTSAIANYKTITNGGTITAANLVNGWTASWGTKHTFTLKKGQTLNIQAKSQNANSHLGGTIITSTGNIAVQWKDDSLHELYKHNPKYDDEYDGEGGCYDLIGDQIVPTKLAGTEYIVMRGQLGHYTSGNGIKGEYVYLMSIKEGTTNITAVSDNGTTVTVPSLTGKGSMTRILLNSKQVNIEPKENYDALHITADKPIIVMHMAGFGCEVGGAILPTINGCTGSTEVSVCRSTDEGFFLNIMCKKAHINDFYVDVTYKENNTIKYRYTNVHLDQSWFKEIPNTGWCYLSREHVEFQLNSGDIRVKKNDVVKVKNITGLFHLAIINGGTGSGCRYGYFSNFSDDYGHAVTVSDEFESDYSAYCYGDTISLQATGGITYLWKYSQGLALGHDTTFLSENDKTSATPRVHPPTGTNVYQVTIWRACYKGLDVDTTINVWTYGYGKITSDFNITELGHCSPKGVVVENNSTGASLYSWQLNNGSESNAVS
ncbi:MAG: IgGFc-binding protein, partial [Salinivirgaceae bacterium]|nr:IgGFc-binding protein [Salinivirgaceae bacterium]